MTTKHLSEAEIQQYAIDPSHIDPWSTAHMQSCQACGAAVEAYQKIFSAIHQQPRPSFDFDLSALILPQLGKPAPGNSSKNWSLYFLVIVAIAIPLMAAIKYWRYLKNSSMGMLPMTISLLITATLCILVFQSIEMVRRYQKQINLLN